MPDTVGPFTRWWWFSGEILKDDIRYQLDWLKENGFGGVEIAWVYPLPGSKPGCRFLSDEWTELAVFTRRHCDEIGLLCDFTLGTLWPFGGSWVTEADASKTYEGVSGQRLKWTWEDPHTEKHSYLIDHLDSNALWRYMKKIGDALGSALGGGKSCLFTDSWEVESEGLWTDGFGEEFRERYGYDIGEYMENLDSHPDIRYDYRKLISEYVLDEFFRPLGRICFDEYGSGSRVQCHGAPTDLLAAYASAHIPETEALLYEPGFARIAASAAAFTGKGIVSCEAFTCLYGWVPRPGPAPHIKKEFAGDIKLLADSLFANGVNSIVWHGMPYNPEGGKNEFYATVHVGPDSSFAKDIPALNAWMAKVQGYMKLGSSYSNVAVYLPLEDQRMANELPENGDVVYPPGAKYHWELRYLTMPEELYGYNPLWVSGEFLKSGTVRDGILNIGGVSYRLLYIDSEWIDPDNLELIVRLAVSGLEVVIKKPPAEPGRNVTDRYSELTEKLFALRNVSDDISKTGIGNPVVRFHSDVNPEYWCRKHGEDYYFFIANPHTRTIRYPLRHGQYRESGPMMIRAEFSPGGFNVERELEFEPCQSWLVRISESGDFENIDITLRL